MKIETHGIGTTWWIDIFDQNVENALEQCINQHIKLFQDRYSRFQAESFISQLNTRKVLTDFPDELYAMLSYCQTISQLTDYRFNVCSGVIQHVHGYDAEYSLSEKEMIEPAILRNGIVQLSKDRIEISEDVMIDLGGIGKGWLIDTLKLMFESHGIKYFAINGGGDIYATSNHGDPIRFYLENPFNTEEYIGTVDLKEEAFACSSPSRRIWKTRQGTMHHHLVDSTTGESVTHCQAVFTAGATGLAVDVASTCIFISPIEEADKLAQALEIEYFMILPDGKGFMSKKFPGKINHS